MKTSPNDIVEFLKANNFPVNRENYLAITFLGNPPEELDAEQEAEIQNVIAAWGAMGKIGPAPSSGTRKIDATMDATATGTKLRGFHSKSSSSTASNTAATGVAKTADIPAAAPATSNVFRSAADRLNN